MSLDPDISPELAKKGLDADARNALASLAQGDQLPTAKRELLERVIEAQADPAAVLQKRRSRLLHIYVTAQRRLNEDELAEIADILPDPMQIERRLTKERYSQPQEFYAAKYGYAVRNIKKWLGIGREKCPPDLPPLDSPEQMPAWWSRNMKQRVPQRLLSGAIKPEQKSSAGTPPAPEAEKPSQKPPTQPQPTDVDALKGTGYAAMLARVNHAELVAWDRWQKSLNKDPFDPSEEEMLRRAYDRAGEQARKVLKDRDSGLAGDDDWGRWEDFEQLAQEHISVLNQSLRSTAVRVATKMALPPELFHRLGEAINEELDRIFETLARTNWRQVVATDTEENFSLAAE